MQEVHTRMRLAAPFTMAWTVCKLRFQRRLVTLWAWLILLPNRGPRPQTSHTFAMVIMLLGWKLQFISFDEALATRHVKSGTIVSSDQKTLQLRDPPWQATAMLAPG